jgi:ribosomal protein S18 acetylase RimI-like enzyme
MEVRDAREADIPGLDRLERRSFAADRLSRRSMRRLIASRSARLRVAANGVLDGYHLTLFRKGAGIARLYSIAVAHRGSGAAQLLMEDAERLAVREGCRAVRLEVRPDNPAAIRLYERSGYRRIGIRRRYYADGADAIRYEKPLAARGFAHAGRDGRPMVVKA